MTNSTAMTANRRGLGRPSKLTPEVQEVITDSIRKGNYFVTASRAAGVSDYTRMLWIRKALEDIENGNLTVYVHFMNAIKEAEAYAQTKLVEVIRKAAKPRPTSWQAAAWLLERRWPEIFGKSDTHRMEITGADGQPIKKEITIDLTDATKEALEILVNAGAVRLAGDDENVIDVAVD